LFHKYSPDTERAAECQHLIEEIKDFYEELNDKEKTFISDMEDRFTKYGLGTYVSDDQYEWIKRIYENVC
jgi:DnaJ-class molecular chaperone